MEFYLVYVASDSMDSACAEDISLSRVFNNVINAGLYYDSQRAVCDPDCMQLWQCEFVKGVLTPARLICQCGNQIASFGL